MDFSYSEKVIELEKKLHEFMDGHIYPNEELYQKQVDEKEIDGVLSRP